MSYRTGNYCTFGRSESFYSVESSAQGALRGLWSCRTIDDGGSDSGQAHIEWAYAEASYLNGERVQFENAGGERDPSGYTLEDAAGHSYTFPDGFTLGPGESVRVHSGSGDADSDDLYAEFGSEVWNDDGDKSYLYDEDGDEVDSRSY